MTSRRGRVVGGPSDGGYLLLRSQFMRTHGSKLQSELLTRAKLDRVYDALNVCSGRAWYSSVVFECEAREYLFSDSLTHSTHSYDIHNPQLSSLSLSRIPVMLPLESYEILNSHSNAGTGLDTLDSERTCS